MVRILVVDGNTAIRRLLVELFRSCGYEVDEAADGLQALERFAICPSDVVLMGVRLPRMDGWETCRRLRQLSLVPVLMMSAHGHPAMLEQVLACGASAFVLKPIEFEGVLSWVDTVSQKEGRGVGALAVMAQCQAPAL